MSYSISYQYEIVDRFSKPLAKIAAAARRSSTEIIKQTDRIAASLTGVSSAANRTKKVVDNLSSLKASLAQTTLEAERMRRTMEKQIKIPPLPAMPRMPGLPFAKGTGGGGIGGKGAGKGIGTGAGGIVQAVAGITLPTMALEAVFKSSADLEESQSNLRRLLNTNEQVLGDVFKDSEKISQKYAMSTKDVLDMEAGLASAGFQAQELNGAMDLVSRVKIGGEFESFKEAGELFALIRSQLKKTTPEMSILMDMMNKVADNTETNLNKMVTITNRASGSLSGYSSLSQTVTVGMFANLGVAPEAAATAASKIIPTLQKMKGPFGELARKDIAKAIDVYFTAIRKLDKVKQIRILQKTFGQEHYDVTKKLAELDGLYEKVMKEASSPEAIGSLERETDQYLKLMNTKLKKLSGSWENLKAKIFDVKSGEGFLDVVNNVLLKLGEFVEKHPDVTRFGVVFIAAFAAMGVAALAFSAVGGPALLAVGSVAAIAGAIDKANQSSSSFSFSLNRINKDLNELFSSSEEKSESWASKLERVFNGVADTFAFLVALMTNKINGFVRIVGALGGSGSIDERLERYREAKALNRYQGQQLFRSFAGMDPNEFNPSSLLDPSKRLGMVPMQAQEAINYQQQTWQQQAESRIHLDLSAPEGLSGIVKSQRLAPGISLSVGNNRSVK